MRTEVLEIIELEEGTYALQKSDEDEQSPMISIRFSEQIMRDFDGQQVELARDMIALGVKVLVETRQKQLLDSLSPIIH